MDKMTIRFSDRCEDVSAIHNALYNYNLSKTGAERKETHAAQRPDQYALVVRNEDDEFCGGLVFHHVEDLPELYVSLFFIEDSLRGKGIGSTVFEKLTQYAKEHNIQGIKLTTNTFQALGFYQKLGFDIIGEKPYPAPLCPENIQYSLFKKL